MIAISLLGILIEEVVVFSRSIFSDFSITLLRHAADLSFPVLAAALLFSCGEKGLTEPGRTPTISGTWLGTTEFLTPSGKESWRLSLTVDADGYVSGTYLYSSPEWGSVSGVVSGSYEPPSVSLLFSIQLRPSTNAQSYIYSGTMEASGQTISGRLSWSLRLADGEVMKSSGPMNLRRS